MSLAGSLAAFPLEDVLDLLTTTDARGFLHVRAGDETEVLGIDRGALVGTRSAVLASLQTIHDLEDAAFEFDPDGAPEGHERVTVADALAAAEGARRDRAEMCSIVPTVEHRLVLVARDPAAGPVIIESESWTVVRAVGDGRSLARVLERCDCAPLAVYRQVGALIERGLLSVEDPLVAEPPLSEFTPYAAAVGGETAFPAEPVDAPLEDIAPPPARAPISAPLLQLTRTPTAPQALEDRGPWPSHELAALVEDARAGDESDDEEVDTAGVAPPRAGTAAPSRGSLLRFFSTVRA